MPFREDHPLVCIFVCLSQSGFDLGATATLPELPPDSEQHGEERVWQGERDARACETCVGCVRCAVVGASVCRAGSVCVCGDPTRQRLCSDRDR